MVNCEFVIYPMIVNIYEYEYMKTIYVNCQLKQLKIKSNLKKNSGLNGIRSHDLSIHVA